MGVTARIATDPLDSELLSRFFAEFLDESTFAEFRRIERQFGSLREQGSTVSGYPMIRPRDCAAITRLLESVFLAGKERFRTQDAVITERFERLIAAFHEFSRKIFPGEATAALVLHGKVLLFMGRPEEVIALVSDLALRPYAVENSVLHNLQLVELLGQAHLRLGTLDRLPISFVAFAVWLTAQVRSISPAKAAIRMAPMVSAQPLAPGAPLLARLARGLSVRFLAAMRGRNGIWRKLSKFSAVGLYIGLLALTYRLMARKLRLNAPFALKMNPTGPILVTRAMGGIGDLLMMQPGLEALARSLKKPVDFAIPRKFFPIFQNDPHIRLIDIEGPVIDVSQYSAFVNLTLCPAGRYESGTRPNVKRGRVEIFARAMGVKPHQLRAQGWHINRPNNAEEEAFCDGFLREKGLGTRPLIGIQPYSRDSYKDHPRIDRIIAALSQDHDILFFHHVADGLPRGRGFADTAGVALANSLALVSRVDAMVCVDSAFLHAAAAYDVPVIAMFGPTDARTFTRHHRNTTILWKPQTFGCVPCWRNEDLPCHVTGTISSSPCMAAITPEEVVAAVTEAIEPRR